MEFDINEDLSDVGVEYVVTPAAPPKDDTKPEPAAAAVKRELVKEENGAEEADVKSEAKVAKLEETGKEEDDEAPHGEDAEHLGSVTCVCHSLGNYTFGKGRHASAKSKRTFRERMFDHKARYETDGCRVTVQAVLLAHVDGVAHVLVLRKRQDRDTEVYGLPQTRVRTGEDAVKSLGRCLNKTVSKEQSWTVLAQIGKFTRPEFNDSVYPYELPHVSHPKEAISLFLVQMEPFTAFTVSQSAVMGAMPLMQLYKADKKYGDIIAALPLFLSRFGFVFS
jgi:hypothetical protein